MPQVPLASHPEPVIRFHAMTKLVVGIWMLGSLVACAARTVEPRSPESAVCDDGKTPSCIELAERHEHGRGVPKSTVKALEFYLLACQHDVASACAAAGHLSLGGDGVPIDEVKSKAFLEKACMLNEPIACNNLGTAYSEGKNGVGKVDHAKARMF
jgi:uncharacterized protein